jgi:hypothetical protein
VQEISVLVPEILLSNSQGRYFLEGDERKMSAKFINNFILRVFGLCGIFSFASPVDIHLHGIDNERIFSTNCYPIVKKTLKI